MNKTDGGEIPFWRCNEQYRCILREIIKLFIYITRVFLINSNNDCFETALEIEKDLKIV